MHLRTLVENMIELQRLKILDRVALQSIQVHVVDPLDEISTSESRKLLKRKVGHKGLTVAVQNPASLHLCRNRFAIAGRWGM